MEIALKTNLFIVDDHQLVVDGLRSLLYNEAQYEIVGFSNQPKEVIDMLDQLKVDVLLTDINMPDMTGVELTRAVKKRFPKIKILALSMFGEIQVIKEMIDAGVSGYILKNTGKEELVEALGKLANGQSFFGEEVTRELMKNFSSSEESFHLTNREIEIIRLIESEYSNRQMADLLFISERTVETHRKNIFRKTGTQSIVGLVKYAYEHKII
ncbi:response regulator [Pedobacter insulae]|uniref:DNA-binding response regulator, NarL/FixJ family, contains REC and HTH domains n=1 Tax=Pedobacter insulae TaxID=414048 RepID=A0A1I2YTK7_9SPHI|nr:response regulator transcription factor [Pedobacter insulae]SFH28599.1 DNA-binding response regulator, NarL/FixJ family, contains REC and HTH domains [Pedobacter insulae]